MEAIQHREGDRDGQHARSDVQAPSLEEEPLRCTGYRSAHAVNLPHHPRRPSGYERQRQAAVASRRLEPSLAQVRAVSGSIAEALTSHRLRHGAIDGHLAPTAQGVPGSAWKTAMKSRQNGTR
jgi:hypothetical protein